MLTTTAIAFPVVVRGKEITAQVLGQQDHPLYHVFQVKFSDGFEDSFFILDNGFIEGNKQGASVYSKALRNDLPNLISMEAGGFASYFPYVINNSKTNVWVFETFSEEGEQVFNVYYNRDYRFGMKKMNGRWYARSIRLVEPEIIDDKLAAKIGHFIDCHL